LRPENMVHQTRKISKASAPRASRINSHMGGFPCIGHESSARILRSTSTRTTTGEGLWVDVGRCLAARPAP